MPSDGRALSPGVSSTRRPLSNARVRSKPSRQSSRTNAISCPSAKAATRYEGRQPRTSVAAPVARTTGLPMPPRISAVSASRTRRCSARRDRAGHDTKGVEPDREGAGAVHARGRDAAAVHLTVSPWARSEGTARLWLPARTPGAPTAAATKDYPPGHRAAWTRTEGARSRSRAPTEEAPRAPGEELLIVAADRSAWPPRRPAPAYATGSRSAGAAPAPRARSAASRPCRSSEKAVMPAIERTPGSISLGDSGGDGHLKNAAARRGAWPSFSWPPRSNARSGACSELSELLQREPLRVSPRALELGVDAHGVLEGSARLLRLARLRGSTARG